MFLFSFTQFPFKWCGWQGPKCGHFQRTQRLDHDWSVPCWVGGGELDQPWTHLDNRMETCHWDRIRWVQDRPISAARQTPGTGEAWNGLELKPEVKVVNQPPLPGDVPRQKGDRPVRSNLGTPGNWQAQQVRHGPQQQPGRRTTQALKTR